MSPQGTRNINLGGIYHYDRENSKAIDIEGMVAALGQVLEDLLARDKNAENPRANEMLSKL